jgi:hypothetical protein
MEDPFCDSPLILAKFWLSSSIEETYERKDALDKFIHNLENPKPERKGQLPVYALFTSSGGGKSHFIDYSANYLHKSKKYYPIVISFNNTTSFLPVEDCSLAFCQRIIWTYVTHPPF